MSPPQLLPTVQEDTTVVIDSKMDSTYHGKPKQQTRPIFLILGTFAVASVFWFFLRPAAVPAVPVVHKVSGLLRGENMSNIKC